MLGGAVHYASGGAFRCCAESGNRVGAPRVPCVGARPVPLDAGVRRGPRLGRGGSRRGGVDVAPAAVQAMRRAWRSTARVSERAASEVREDRTSHFEVRTL